MEDKNFEIIYHTADVGVKVWGKTLKGVFKNSAKSLLTLISDVKKVEPSIKVKGRVEGDDIEELLVNFLNEIIFIHEMENMVFSDVEITSFNKKKVNFTLFGEKYNPEKHSINFGVKACTYYGLKINKKDSIFETRIIFDT